MAEAKTVNLTSPDRVLYPDDAITKGDLFAYYQDVASTLHGHPTLSEEVMGAARAADGWLVHGGAGSGR